MDGPQIWKSIPNVRDTVPRWKDKGRLKLDFFLSIIFVGLFLNGYDGSLVAGLQAFDTWQQDMGLADSSNAAALIGVLNAAPQIAGFIVGPLIQFIDDRMGRRWGIRFYGWSMLIGTVISVVAGTGGATGLKGFAIFIIGRFIIGFGLASFLMTSLVVVQEISHPHSRETVSGSWDSWYLLGLVLESWVVFGTSYMSNSWGWRIPYLIQLPMALYILIAVQFVPETPRWLIAQGRDDEAFQFFVKYHGNGNPEDPLVLFQFEEIKEVIRKEQEARAEKWSVILRSPANRHRIGLAVLLMVCTNVSGTSILYNYYSVVFDKVGITGASTQTGIAAGLNFFTYFVQLASVWSLKHIGRRTIMLSMWPMLLLCLIGLCVSGWAFEHSDSTNNHAGIATVVLVWLFQGFYNFTNPVLWSYPSEIQTFSMRSKTLLIWNSIAQCTGVYVSFVDSIALNKISWRYYIVYMPILVIEWLLLHRYMVETRGYTLEEIALAFDSTLTLPLTEHVQAIAKVDAERDVEGDGK